MIELLFDSIFSNLTSFIGSPILVGVMFMAVFAIIAMLLGLPFDFALLLTAPIPYALERAGYLETWVAGLIIVIVLGFSIYMIWTRLQNK